jgi:hypothetical protein
VLRLSVGLDVFMGVAMMLDDLFIDITGSRDDVFMRKIVIREPRLIKALTVFTFLLGAFGAGLDVGSRFLR